MKIYVCLVVALAFGFSSSCASKSPANAESAKVESIKNTTEEKSEKVVEQAEAAVESRYNYDRDWEIIKTEIIKKDKTELADWIRGDQVSADDLVMIFSDPNVLKALKATSYNDLKSETIEGEVYLKFYYEETGADDEGNEVGMSITLYMFQGDPNFQISHMIAAG